MFAPDKVRLEVALFSVTPVTLVPMIALISVPPLPVPEFVMVPVLLTVAPERVIPLAIELLLFRVRLPVPLTPPVRVSNDEPLALLFVRVVPPPFTVSAPLTVSAEVALFSVIPVTFVPTAALIRSVAPPAPELVIVPALFTDAVDSVITPAPVALSVRLPVPVTPPLKVRALAPAVRVRS